MPLRAKSVVVGVLVVVGAAASIAGIYLTARTGEVHPLLLTGMAATAAWIAIDEESSDATGCSERCSCASGTEESP